MIKNLFDPRAVFVLLHFALVFRALRPVHSRGPGRILIAAAATLLNGLASYAGAVVLYAVLQGRFGVDAFVATARSGAGGSLYGSLAASWAAMSLFLLAALRAPSERGRVARSQVTFWLLMIACLRVECFVQGCCWGRLSRSALFSVVYPPDGFMPSPLVPVHPVQLYESALCLALLALSGWLHRGRLFALRPYCLLFAGYAAIRLVAEPFRAHPQPPRLGWVGLGTDAQVISVGVLCCAILALATPRRAPAKSEVCP